LSLQEPEPSEFIGLGTGRLPPAPVQVGLVNEAQLGHGLSKLRETDPDPSRDKADHIPAVHRAAIDPICDSPLESDSEDDREVYMVGQGDHAPEKTTEELQCEADEVIAWAARLARE
jgi:hypothetical protein